MTVQLNASKELLPPVPLEARMTCSTAIVMQGTGNYETFMHDWMAGSSASVDSIRETLETAIPATKPAESHSYISAPWGVARVFQSFLSRI